MDLIRQYTATAYVIENDRVLLLMHPKFGKWLPPGGHVEPNEIPYECAIRETLEETGLEIELIGEENLWIDYDNASSIPRPYLCLLENIPPYKDQPYHQHIDSIYAAKPVGGTLIEGVRWFTLDEVQALESGREIFQETKETIAHLFEARKGCGCRLLSCSCAK